MYICMYKYVYIYTCTHVCKRMIIYVDEYLAPTKKKKQFQDLKILPTSTRVFGWEQAWDLPTERNTK